MNRLMFLTTVLAVAVSGCGTDGPPVVRFGQEACSHCRMIVSDDRFAATARTPAGDSLKYDDVCCLVDHAASDPERMTRRWVRGYQSGRWHEADTMHFVYGPTLQTPMGSGLAAVETQAEADTLATAWGGRVLRFHELKGFLDAKADSPDREGRPRHEPAAKPSQENR